MVFGFAYCSICPGHSACGSQTKSKLLKPLVLLPMGRYLAGIQHLRMIQFGKGEHGLREKDIDYM